MISSNGFYQKHLKNLNKKNQFSIFFDKVDKFKFNFFIENNKKFQQNKFQIYFFLLRFFAAF